MRIMMIAVVAVLAVCLTGDWSVSQVRPVEGRSRNSTPDVWLKHQALTAGPSRSKVRVRLFFRTSAATVADSLVISWSEHGANPDSVAGERQAVPYRPSHLDSLMLRRNFNRTDTIVVAGWTRLQNKWARQLMDTIVVARDTLRPHLDQQLPDTDTIPPAKINDLG